MKSSYLSFGVTFLHCHFLSVNKKATFPEEAIRINYPHPHLPPPSHTHSHQWFIIIIPFWCLAAGQQGSLPPPPLPPLPPSRLLHMYSRSLPPLVTVSSGRFFWFLSFHPALSPVASGMRVTYIRGLLECRTGPLPGWRMEYNYA